MVRVHATCVTVDGNGVLLRGPPGCGKSDLALRLIDTGARLVADDQTELRLSADRLEAFPPPAIAGFLEVRGVGVVPIDNLPSALLSVVVDLVASDAVERVPEAERCVYLGVAIPLFRLSPFEASAPAKVRLAVKAATGLIMPVP
ncbi:MAG: HPr kinase/phosphatase C-terminal domain-containing protein [Rhodospirillales bacterium]|jgi:serine kinase of HPr protein (carbohydrate metabolism regulator)|nr:HPr kinase/phosphatase C-terminal domain-containing protein [Rhodospirillales bacterium]